MTDQGRPRYIRAAEIAKMIRVDLKRHFPTVKFSVRTEHGTDHLGEHGAVGTSAKSIPPDDAYRGVGFLLAEGGIPRRFKAAYLDDDQIDDVIAHALRIRHRPAG